MIKNVIPFVHDILSETITKKDIVIDATCGNGHDTLFLSELSHHVYAFDIQEMAINNAKELLKDASNVTFILDSHAKIRDYVKEKVKAVTFNLGYLPGSDKSIVTVPQSTIEAIKQSLSLLEKNGIVALTLYIGHEGGKQEADFVEDYVSSLDKKTFQVVKYHYLNRKTSPYVILIQKNI